MFNLFRRRPANDDGDREQQPAEGRQQLPPIDTVIQSQPSTESNGSSANNNASTGVPVAVTNSGSDPSPKSAGAHGSGSSPSQRHRTSSPSPLYERGDSSLTSAAHQVRPSSASPPPPSSYQPNWRTEAAPTRLSYKSFGQNSLGRSDGYPSWLPRRPPPPAPASTIGTSTPMPAELGEFGETEEFERQYREYLAQVQQSDVGARPSTAGGGEGTDMEGELDDSDYLRGGAQLMQGRESAESPVDPIPPAQLGGRKATPRSVRIVNLQQEGVAQGLGVTTPPAREPTDATAASGAAALNLPLGFGHARTHSQSNWYSRKRGTHGKRISSGSTAVNQQPQAQSGMRAFSRATAPPTTFQSIATSGGFSGVHPHDHSRPGERRTRPKFNIRGLQLEMLRSPSRWMRVYYRLWPILVLGHLPLQAFLDFNAVYMILQVSRYPLPTASPRSGKNWALCAAAYIACWLISVLVIFVLYELVYSFARKWRVRRPLIFPLYLSAAGYNYASMTSFNVFCFFQHLRYTAFVPIEPDLGLDDSSSSSSSRGSAEIDEKDLAEDRAEAGAIVEEPRTPPATHQGHRDRHVRSESTESVDDAKEDDPALGRHSRSKSGHQRSKSNSPAGSNFFQTTMKTLKKTKRNFKRQTDRITWRDGLSETFNLYAQNLPNVVCLLPRAALALGLVLSFGSGRGERAASLGTAINRDSTFFRRENGLLTNYALGVLYANIIWTLWRVIVLLSSWIGLWILSGHSCAGICGPRDKWEEEEHNRLSAAFSIGSSLASDDDSVLPWEWRECTKARVQDAWEFCLVGVGSGRYRWSADLGGKMVDEKRRISVPPPRDEKKALQEEDDGGLSDEGLKRVLAAVGFPSMPSPAKRAPLRQDLFESPSKDRSRRGSPSDLEGAKDLTETQELPHTTGGMPLMALPYPFSKPGTGQVSSNDRVPFPTGGDRDSGKSSDRKSKSAKSEKSTTSGSRSGSSKTGSGSSSSEDAQEEEEDEEEDDDDEEEEEEDEKDGSSSHRYSEEPSTPSHSSGSRGGRASNSMSSLGHPIPATLGMATIRPGYSPSPTHGRRPRASARSGSSASSPLSWRSDTGGSGGPPPGLVHPGGNSPSTRFPFLSGPPAPSHMHRHPRVSGQHTGSSGHSRGLSQVSGLSALSGMSLMSAGSGYAASGSAGMSEVDEGAVSEEGVMLRHGMLTATRDTRDRHSSGESAGSAGLPMPPRHPHLVQEGRARRRSRAGTGPSSSSSSASPVSSSSPPPAGLATFAIPEQPQGVAFPSVGDREGKEKKRPRVDQGTFTSGKVTPPNAEDIELGLGALAHQSAMRAIRGRSRRMGEDDGESLQLSLRDDDDTRDAPAAAHRDVASAGDDSDDSMYEDDEEVQGEREDVVGLLGSASGNNSAGPSPRASIVGLQQGQQQDPEPNVGGSRSRTRSRHSSSAKSRESLRLSVAGRPLSLSLISGQRSRHSSFNRPGYSTSGADPAARVRRDSVASAVRERASSFGVRMRERAQSLMQSVVRASGAGDRSSIPSSPIRGDAAVSVANLAGHRRLGSSSGDSAFEPMVVTGTARARMPEVVRVSESAEADRAASAIVPETGDLGPIQRSISQETGESSGSSGGVPRHQQLIDEEAYYSSGTSHSRSGSESMNHGLAAENNYTFGQPVPFMQPREPALEVTPASPSPPRRRSPPQVTAPSSDDEAGEQFFSQPTSPRSPRSRATSHTPSLLSSGMLTPVPTNLQPAFLAQQQQQHQPQLHESQSIPILISDSPPDVFLQPPSGGTNWSRSGRSLSPSSGDYLSVREGAESVMMLSSAAQSFVTAPISIAESGTTTTGMSGGSGSTDTGTIGGSWDEDRGFVSMFLGGAAARANLSQRGRRDPGMVERAGDVVGAGGNIGDGRIA